LLAGAATYDISSGVNENRQIHVPHQVHNDRACASVLFTVSESRAADGSERLNVLI
jgi:hypothetical protein